MAKYLDQTGLETVIQKIVEVFVQKETGKGLSSNDFTSTLKTKLENLESDAQVNDIEVVKRNGIALPISGKAVDVSVPTKTSQLTNDSTFTTTAEVNNLINQINKITKQIVTSLPATGSDNIMYLIKNTAPGDSNVYDEWLWIDSKWEKIGDTATVVDVSALTTAEIDGVFTANGI